MVVWSDGSRLRLRMKLPLLLASLTSRRGGEWREWDDASHAAFLSSCVPPSSSPESTGGGVGSRRILCLRMHLLNSNSAGGIRAGLDGWAMDGWMQCVTVSFRGRDQSEGTEEVGFILGRHFRNCCFRSIDLH